jgi:hypothetical protein
MCRVLPISVAEHAVTYYGIKSKKDNSRSKLMQMGDYRGSFGGLTCMEKWELEPGK